MQPPALSGLLDLGDKVAIVTGAGQSIGKAIALRLSEAGAAVLVTDINEDPVRRVADRILSAGGRAAALRADVAQVSETLRTVEAAALVPYDASKGASR